MNESDMCVLLDELVANGSHVAHHEAVETKEKLRRALIEAAEVLIRHEKMLARDAAQLDRRWSV